MEVKPKKASTKMKIGKNFKKFVSKIGNPEINATKEGQILF